MKIVQITGMRSTKYGGLEKYFVEMARFLNSKGDKLYLVYNTTPYSHKYIEDLKKYNVEIIISDFFHCGNWSFSKKLVKLIREIKPDIIHFHFANNKILSLYIPKLMGVKKVYKTIHSLPFKEGRISLLSKLRFRLFYLAFNRIIAVSQNIKKEICKATGGKESKIEVHYTGTHLSKVKKVKSKEAEKIRIGCVAFHNEIKGIDILLEAIHKLKTIYKLDSFELIQIGGGNEEYKEKLINLCNEYNITDVVNWYGTTDDVPQVLSSMDIYVQPSRQEGIGMALMEAATNGLPLIGSNIGGIPEVIIDGRNGYLFSVGDSDKLASRLYELSKNENLRESMGEQSRILVNRKFNITENIIKLINELY